MSGYYHQLDQVWPSGNLIPIPVSQVTAWKSISRLIKQGSLKPGVSPGQGDAPFRKIFLDKSKKNFATGATNWLTMIPANHNSDSFGYNEKEVGGTLDSWAALFDSHFSGHVALISDPDIGFIDAGMAAKASGKMTMKALGNPTKKEIDDLTTILKDLKKAGQFRAYWANFNESVNLMASKEVVVESMWSPAVALLSEGQSTSGTRRRRKASAAGAAVTASSARRGRPKLQAGYDYLNWWNTRWRATIMRQGYYNGNGTRRPTRAWTRATALGGVSADNYWLKARRPRRRSSAPTARSASRRARTATAAPRAAHRPLLRVELAGVNRDYLLQRWQEFITA